MKVEESLKPRNAVSVTSIAPRLPSMLPSVARAARVGFDRRFEPWLAQVLGQQPGRVFGSRPRTDRLSIDLNCSYGSADVALDPQLWPGLQMATDLPDANLAREVTSALLAPLLARLTRVLPGVEVRAVRRYAPQAVTTCDVPAVALSRGEVALVRLDTTLATHLETQLRSSVSTDLEHFRGLQVPTRLRLFERRLSSQRLSEIAPGDLVLCSPTQRAGTCWRASLSFGLGITMQAHADVDIEQSRVRVTTAPRVVDEDAAASRHSAALDTDGLADLQVPVAFEIDSARVSLGELAALGEGSVIELDVALLEASVRLVCHGQTLGIGQLVAIGDQLGVRIRRMGLVAGKSAQGAAP
jgi:type III secretion protein Q